MKLNYNIIWIEDKFSDKDDSEGRIFYGIKEEVKTFLENQFFNIEKFDVAVDFEKFTAIFDSAKEYDLIITDLSLNDGTTGTQVIDYVRDKKQDSTEILFYSANQKVREQKLTNSNRITYFELTGDYKDLRDTIENLINLTIKKFQHIVSMRGMIMHETSSLDVSLSKIAKKILEDNELVKIKEKYPNYNVENIKNLFLDNLIKNTKEKSNKAQEKKLKNILKDNVLFSSGEKNNVISYFIDELIKNGADITNFTENYKKFISTRNDFAHAELSTDENGKQFFKKGEDGKEGVIFDEDKCKQIRKDIITHKENIKILEDLVKSFE